MRYDFKKAPEGIMDYLFVKLFQYFKEEGKQYFDMGMAPLANVGTEEDSFIEEKVANLVYVFAQRFYSFSGLQRYKRKILSNLVSKIHCLSKKNLAFVWYDCYFQDW